MLDETGKLGRRIAHGRQDVGMSQAELGRHVGVSRSAVAQWERDFTEPAAGHLRQVAAALQLSYNWLATGTGIREPMPGVSTVNEGQRIDPAELPESARPLLTLLGPGKEIWQLSTDKIAGAGYRSGDYLLVALNRKPVAGNFVMAANGEFILFRQFFPPHLFCVAFGKQEPHITVGGMVKTLGVVIARYSL